MDTALNRFGGIRTPITGAHRDVQAVVFIRDGDLAAEPVRADEGSAKARLRRKRGLRRIGSTG
jgi:hypothetical protein